MKQTRPVLMLAYAFLLLVFGAILGCDVLGYTPSRDNPSDPGATVVAPPVFDPPGGTYATPQSVSISCPTTGATIRYTVDGATPSSTSGLLYVAPVSISGTVTLTAIAYRVGMAESRLTSALYTIESAPATPQALSVGSATVSTLSISWSACEGATSYQLYRDRSDVGPFTTVVYDGPALTHTDTGLAGSTLFLYRVRATNGNGSSAPSAAVGGSTLATGSAPAVPTGLAVTSPTSASLTVSWSAADGATSYQLYRDSSAAGGFTTLVHDGPELTYTDTALAAETTYYYKVRATNADGSSVLSEAAAGATVAAASAPAAPAALSVANPTSDSLEIAWSVSPGATSYQLYRDISDAGGFANNVYDGGLLTYTNSGLAAGTTYYYKVRATNASGFSPLSAAVPGTTAAAPAPTVYVGGQYQDASSNTIACYWIDGAKSDVANVSGGYVAGMTVDGTDVYLAGWTGVAYSTSRATYWKNSTPVQLSTNISYAYDLALAGATVYTSVDQWVGNDWAGFAEGSTLHNLYTTYTAAYGVYVSGTDLYVTGYHGASGSVVSCYWKNGTERQLMTGGLGGDRGYDIFVSGGTVWVAGFYKTGSGTFAACYWVDDGVSVTRTDLMTAYNSYATGIFVSGGDVYVSAYRTNGSYYKAYYWKNSASNQTELSPTAVSAFPNGICVFGTDVYVAGFVGDGTQNTACYWKNAADARTDLYTTRESTAVGIVVK